MQEYEAIEEATIIQEGETFSDGNVKEVYRGMHQDVLMPLEIDDYLKQIHEDLNAEARAVNTWIHPSREGDIAYQDFIPDDFHTAALDHGLDHAVEEAVKVEESFIENGYIYADLKPENLRFQESQAVAVDYLDQLAVRPIDKVDDIETALAKSYDLFVTETADAFPNLKRKDVEELVDRHSGFTDAERYTGNPYTDFRLVNDSFPDGNIK